MKDTEVIRNGMSERENYLLSDLLMINFVLMFLHTPSSHYSQPAHNQAVQKAALF